MPFKKGQIPWNKGRQGLYKTSEETKKKLSWTHSGNKNGNWRNGASDKKYHPERLTEGRLRPERCDVCKNIGRICFDSVAKPYCYCD